MSAAVELWLVRHGETEWSASGKHTGSTDIPLTDKGREQARRVGRGLAGVEFAEVRVSPLGRARETCALAGFGERAVVEEGLREWSYGVYEGRSTKEIQAEIPGWNVWKDEIVGGETVEHVGERADGVIERALALGAFGPDSAATHPDVIRTALFAHAHILRILAARWVGLEARGGRLFTLGTGSVSVLGWEREARVVSHWNHSFEGLL